ncbi:MAG: AAA family ATPase [Promethearchaeota archaeon]
MILDSIEIKNIRSIKNELIEFPQSTMLFFGDVGSGKSSVLKSIEFALFGILVHGDLSGVSLLRRGKSKALVKLTFSINGKKYSIQRELSKNRKGKVSQNKCIFTNHDTGTKVSYAPTDMRRQILSLLSYSVPRYENANKLPLFRYTVYTPQEEIKEIIQADPDERFEILKEVFGIEKYELSLKNLEFIKDLLNDKRKELKIKLEQIGDPKEDFLQKEKEIVLIKIQIAKLEEDIKKKENEIISQEKIVNKIHEDLDSYSKKLVQIESKESNIIEYKAKQIETNKKLESIRGEISEKQEEIIKITKIKVKTNLSEDKLESNLEKLQNFKSQKEKDIAIIKKKLEDVNRLLKEGKCSLCGQAIHEKERFEEELQSASKKIEEDSFKIGELSEQIREEKELIKNVREFQKFKTKKESLMNIISEKKKREADLETHIEDLIEKINEDQNSILAILSKYNNTNFQEFKDIGVNMRNNLAQEKSTLNSIISNKEQIGNELGGQRKGLEYLQKELEDLKNKIKTKKILQTKLTYYNELQNWAVVEFPILIRDIEKNILSFSALHFNSYFKEWFHELVEDKNIEVEIRKDDFQPIIYVNGYETPFNDLSGGEKSGLSLAYRLALNKIINERHQEVKTKDLLILDEPTDGFSQQQINRMQPIFEKLNIAQMIIISHERNLDSFVADIFHFKKENHVTRVKKES